MQHVIEAIGAVVALGILYVVVPVIVTTYRRLRGPRQVVCPSAGQAAEIQIDAWSAAASAAFDEQPALRIRDCSRWPENERCAHECLRPRAAAEPVIAPV